MSSSKLTMNTLVLAICQLLSKGLMFIMLPLFTRWLSVDDYGTYDILVTYIALIIPIVTVASSNAVFRLSIEREELRDRYISSAFCLVFFNTVIVIIIMIIINYHIHPFNNLFTFLFLLTVQIFDNFFEGYLRALRQLKFYGICRTVTVVFAALLVTIFVRELGLGLNGLILGYAFGYVVSDIIIVFVSKFNLHFSFKYISVKYIKDLVSYSWALIPNDIAWWVINVSDRQIINLFLGAVSNGIYAIAYKVPNLCSSIFGVFNISWQESASDAIDSDESINYYQNVHDKMLNLLLTICSLVVSLNFLFFDYIFDARYSDARLYSSILVASVIFSTISLFYGGIQISLKRPKANGISTMIGACVNLIIHLLLIRVIGLYAAAVSTLLSNCSVVLTRRMLLDQKYRFAISKKSYILTGLFVYFSILSTQKVILPVNVLNALCSCSLFLYVNKAAFRKIVNKIKK